MYTNAHTVIIGGGASGMCAAILLKRKLINENIVIVEALDRVGKKLIVTGNGRCNITNAVIDLSRYHGNKPEFCYNALLRFGCEFTKEFFGSLGVPFIDGDNGKLYPYSLQASSIVDALRLEMSALGITVLTDTTAGKIIPNKNGYKIICDSCELSAKNVIVATGGLAGGNKLGSFGIGYKLLQELGLKFIETNPSLVQLKTDIIPIKALNGIKQNATVTMCINGKKVRSETGELLFTKYGISGPPVLQISRQSYLNADKTVKINFMPEFNFDEVLNFVKERKTLLKGRLAETFFTGVFPKMLGLTILKACDIKASDYVCEFSDKKCRALAEQIYSFTLKVVGSNGMENAQVTSGGISTADFNDNTMESVQYKGIYATGEVLDIDGDCGGFNLQWAWSSAALAAFDIIGKSV